MNALEVVGATEVKVEFLRPYPFNTSGSPYNFANSLLAFNAFSCISRKIQAFNFDASNDSNGIIFDCKYECQPSAPKPRARCLTANLYARSINLNACLSSLESEPLNRSSFSINSVNIGRAHV